MSFAKGVSSGYLPLAASGLQDIKEAMDTVKPDDKWMHAYTYSGHPHLLRVGLKNVEIMERERLWESSGTLARACTGAARGFRQSPDVGDIRSARVSWRRRAGGDKATKKQFDPDRKIGAAHAGDEQARVITRARMKHLLLAALVITEEQLDRMVSVTQEAIKAVTASKPARSGFSRDQPGGRQGPRPADVVLGLFVRPAPVSIFRIIR